MRCCISKVILATLQALKLSIENFNYGATSEVSAPSSNSRTLFVRHWRKYLKSSSSDSSYESATDDVLSELSGHENECNVVTEETDTITKVEDQMLKEYFMGMYDVHLENLTPPDASRCTRVIDHDHVVKLIDSFKDNRCEQMVILVGMVESKQVNLGLLKEPSTNRVEVLGGNHTREALQTLLKRGHPISQRVKVNLYCPMPRTSALAVGFSHNYILQEKRKPTSFLDKVHLMRECRRSPLESKKQLAEWKDTLTVVFRAKDRRTLQQQYTQHLQMARQPEEIWAKVVQAGEVNDKFYRQLMRLTSVEDISACLDVLLSEGPKAFKARVKAAVDNGLVKSKKTGSKVREATEENTEPNAEHSAEESAEQYDETASKEELQRELESMKEQYDALEIKYNQLQEENRTLKMANEELADGQKDKDIGRKRFREINDDKFDAKEMVEAFWRYDDGKESWLSATILTAYADGKMYKVQYDVDKAISKISKSWIRKC